MWIVCPSVHDDGTPNFAVIHIETVYHAAHLIPVYGPDFIADNIEHFHSYDAFHSFYVNRYADHHAFEIASCLLCLWQNRGHHIAHQLPYAILLSISF
ncbi:hypothetical protein BDR05DRAFT_884725 [Suillus weaverae]|nr:hypothetical protein BDR05DRAFT_884725 [Suillus weaverae]